VPLGGKEEKKKLLGLGEKKWVTNISHSATSWSARGREKEEV